jgi:hypothetical protein
VTVVPVSANVIPADMQLILALYQIQALEDDIPCSRHTHTLQVVGDLVEIFGLIWWLICFCVYLKVQAHLIASTTKPELCSSGPWRSQSKSIRKHSSHQPLRQHQTGDGGRHDMA